MNPSPRQQCFQPKTHVQNMCHSAAFDENPPENNPYDNLKFPSTPSSDTPEIYTYAPPQNHLSRTVAEYSSKPAYFTNVLSISKNLYAKHKIPESHNTQTPAENPAKNNMQTPPAHATSTITRHEPMQSEPKPATVPTTDN